MPNLAESYELSEDKRTYSFTLRKGMKWSDGAPFTTEDVDFWYNNLEMNADLEPSVKSLFLSGGEPATLNIIDEQTFELEYKEPNPNFIEMHLRSTMEFRLPQSPKHYLKDFLPGMADEDELGQESHRCWHDGLASAVPQPLEYPFKHQSRSARSVYLGIQHRPSRTPAASSTQPVLLES